MNLSRWHIWVGIRVTGRIEASNQLWNSGVFTPTKWRSPITVVVTFWIRRKRLFSNFVFYL